MSGPVTGNWEKKKKNVPVVKAFKPIGGRGVNIFVQSNNRASSTKQRQIWVGYPELVLMPVQASHPPQL